MNKVILVTPEELGVLIQTHVRKVLSEDSRQSSFSDDKPMSIDEAAAYLNLPKATLYQFTSARKIPFKKLGKRIVFVKKELSDWIQLNHKRSKKEIESDSRGGRMI